MAFQKGGAGTEVLTSKDWLLSWSKGINHTPFDLLMPFINWPFEYENPVGCVDALLICLYLLHLIPLPSFLHP